MGDSAYLLVEDGGRPVAYAMCAAHDGVMWVTTFVVARSHWGGPAANAVHDAVAAFTAGRGYAVFRGGIKASNHASRRMAERNGSRVIQAVVTYARPMSGPVG
jgi:RimJ/RimL family protein N-acetyltransferase